MRGGAPVASLTEMSPFEAVTVLNLRLWCSGPEQQAEVWNGYRSVLPEKTARGGVRALKHLVAAIVEHGFRPMARRSLACASVGGDEAAFARLITTAHRSNLRDAQLIAMLLVHPAEVETVALLAKHLGAATDAMLKASPLATPRPMPEHRPDGMRLH